MSHSKIHELVAITAVGAMLLVPAHPVKAAPAAASSKSTAQAPAIAPDAVPTDDAQVTPAEAPPGQVAVPTVTLSPFPDPIAINGETAGPAVTMTLEQVIATVIASNPTVQLAQKRIDATADAMGEITAQKNIQVHVEAADTLTNFRTFGPSEISVSPVDVTQGQIPTVVDTSQGTLYSAGSTGSGSTGGITAGIATSGVGSSTTTTTSPLTIVPVTPAAGGTTTTTPSSGSSSGSSGSTSGNAPVGGATAQPQVARLNPHQTGTTTGGSTSTEFSGGSYNNYGATASATKLFDVYGLVSQSEAVQRANVEFYRIDLNRTLNELALTAKNVFYSVLRAQANVTASKEQVANAQATVHDTTIMFNAGTVAHYDVISAQTQLVSAEQNLIAARNNLSVQTETLNNLMHQPIDTNVMLTAPPLPSLPASYDAATEVNRALANRPEIKQAALNIDIANRIERLNSEGLLPTFGVGVTGDVAGPSSTTVGGPPIDAGITAGVSWPILDGGLTKSRVQVAKDNIKTQQVTLDQLHQDVDLEVRSALSDVVDAAVLLNATQQSVTLDTEALRLARVRYHAGAGTLLEVTNAQATLATDQFNLSSAQFQLQTAAASLQRAEGGR